MTPDRDLTGPRRGTTWPARGARDVDVRAPADARPGAAAQAVTRCVAAGLVTLAAGAVLTGCASLAPDATAAADAARAFHAAVEAGDGTSACGLLAPAATEELEQSVGSPCPDAVLAADLTTGTGTGTDVVETHAYGRQAQVVMADDVVFLTVSGGDWVVTAAGCTPRPDRPYDCQVSGG